MDQTTEPRPSRSTIRDVARRAGVSPATVSHALTGARRVDEGTRRRVEAAVAALGYAPNLGARRFRTGRAGAIAVLSSMPAAVAAGPSRLGFLMEVAASAALAALDHGVALILVPPVPHPEAALRHVEIDGALLIEPAENDPFLDLVARRAIPAVAIGRPLDATLPYVDLDHRGVAGMLLDHLHAAGARRVPLLVGARARASHRDAEAVHRERAEAEGAEPLVVRVPEEAGEEGARAATERLLDEAPGLDGLLVPVDAFATGVMRALRDRGLAVPGRVRVATRHDGPRAREERPALTAVDLRLDAVARLGVDRLMAEVAGRGGPAVVPAPPPRLVPRASTGVEEDAGP